MVESFTSPLKEGEKLPELLRRDHPDWDPLKLLDEASRIEGATGSRSLLPGDQVRENEDGTVTVRQSGAGFYEDKNFYHGKLEEEISTKNKLGGGFTETTRDRISGEYSVKDQDALGNSKTISYDAQNHKSGSATHKINRDSVIDTTLNAADVEVKRRETFADTSFHERSVARNGIVTTFDQQADGSFKRSRFAPYGNHLKTQIHQLHPDHSVTDTTYDAFMAATSNQETDAAGRFTRVSLDNAKLDFLSEDARGSYSRALYDEDGHIMKEHLHKRGDGKNFDDFFDGKGKLVSHIVSPGDQPFSANARAGETRPGKIVNREEFLHDVSRAADAVEAAELRSIGRCAKGARETLSLLAGNSWKIEGGDVDRSINVDPRGWRSGITLAKDLAASGLFNVVPLSKIPVSALKEGYILGRYHQPGFAAKYPHWQGEDMGDIEITTASHKPVPDGLSYRDSFVLIPKE